MAFNVIVRDEDNFKYNTYVDGAYNEDHACDLAVAYYKDEMEIPVTLSDVRVVDENEDPLEVIEKDYQYVTFTK